MVPCIESYGSLTECLLFPLDNMAFADSRKVGLVKLIHQTKFGVILFPADILNFEVRFICTCYPTKIVLGMFIHACHYLNVLCMWLCLSYAPQCAVYVTVSVIRPSMCCVCDCVCHTPLNVLCMWLCLSYAPQCAVYVTVSVIRPSMCCVCDCACHTPLNVLCIWLCLSYAPQCAVYVTVSVIRPSMWCVCDCACHTPLNVLCMWLCLSYALQCAVYVTVPVIRPSMWCVCDCACHTAISDLVIFSYQDVKLTATNDDQYFVFEDFLYQVCLQFQSIHLEYNTEVYLSFSFFIHINDFKNI